MLGRTQIYSRADVKLWQLESRVVVKNFQFTYQVALKDFRQWGPAAFALHFENLNEDEKKWLIRELNKFDYLPELVLTETTLRFYDEKALIAELFLSDIARGVFKFPGKTFE